MTKLPKYLFSKQGAIAAELAKEFLKFQEGDRIPRITDYSIQFGVGNGTIQAAFQILSDMGALRLAAKGHKGTHIAEINYPILWQATGREVVFGAMALPYTNRFSGLATGLKHVFNEQNIPFALAFMRGVLSRSQSLKDNRTDFMVCSRFSGEKLCSEDPDLEIWCGFGSGSHVSNHVVLVPENTENTFTDGIKVCVDKDSIDQLSLTQAEFSDLSVEFIEVSYMQIPLMLQRGEADAAVWNVDEIMEKNLPLKMIPLRNPRALGILSKCTESVIVTQKESNFGNFLDHIIDTEKVLEVQKQVIKGLKAPKF
ncbi:GntR family transcriptional regulator YhfZ [Neobacillus pocheonensis]|uniref:GntR family transcriptional regulator YhfZ n=1 Tax=Neobacillus pocheonensis TaxID=363869 RepID=UPI003D2A8E1F